MFPTQARSYQVNIGCGDRHLASLCRDIGLSDIQGLDGEWVLTDDLCIAPHQFRRTDLTKPVTPDRKYDLAICLEVAEHLPASSASTLVDSLTQACFQPPFPIRAEPITSTSSGGTTGSHYSANEALRFQTSSALRSGGGPMLN